MSTLALYCLAACMSDVHHACACLLMARYASTVRYTSIEPQPAQCTACCTRIELQRLHVGNETKLNIQASDMAGVVTTHWSDHQPDFHELHKAFVEKPSAFVSSITRFAGP